MPKGHTNNPKGRTPLPIDPAEVRRLANEGANNCDIADFFGCDEGTIRKRFASELRRGRVERRVKLRNWQTDLAESGNATMLIWLGKNELGQTEKQTIEHTGPDGGPMQTENTFKFDHGQHASLYRQFIGVGSAGGDGRDSDSPDRN